METVMSKQQKMNSVKNYLKSFLRDETGAITVEWVVLTAGVIALGIGAYSAFSFELDDSTTNELDFIAMTLMQNNGMLDKPDRGPIGELIHAIRYKMTAFKSCLGAPMSSTIGTMQGGDWACDL
jgi:Flp pilus assembly pilin Flp